MRPLVLVLTVLLAGCKAEDARVPAAAPAPQKPSARQVAMAVTEEGFVPASVVVKAGEPVVLVVTRKTEETCATELLIDGTSINAKLPLDTPVEIAWTPTKAGAVKFGCAMDKMIGGLLLVE